MNRKTGDLWWIRSAQAQTHAHRLTPMTESRHGLQNWLRKNPRFNYFYTIFALISTQCNAHIHRKHSSLLISDSVFSLLVRRDALRKSSTWMWNWGKVNTNCKIRKDGRMLSELLGCYLSDDLAVLSVDLGDATPLCQEGEDLIQLQEEDSDIEKSYLCQNRHP